MIVTLGLGLALAACGGKAATCEQVAEKLHSLMPAELAEKIPAKSMEAKCEKEFNPRQRECVMNAESLQSANICEKVKM